MFMFALLNFETLPMLLQFLGNYGLADTLNPPNSGE
jgi:hypothetical protein